MRDGCFGLFLCAFVAACSDPSPSPNDAASSADMATDGGAADLAPPSDLTAPRPPRAPDLIATENAKPGDASFRLDDPPPGHEIEGYGDPISLAPGGAVSVHVNVDATRTVTWMLYRLGWYGGAGARKLAEGGPVAVAPQPACPRDATTSRVECSWAKAFDVTLPSDAVSGVYVIKLRSSDHHDAHVPFVVTDGRPADILVNISVLTWQAYNAFGGESLYSDASGTMPHQKAWEVSFDRPFDEGHGSGRLLQWEYHLIRFVEALGYDVTYTTGFDLVRDPGQVQLARMFLSIGNDEYWIDAERTAVQAARDLGVSLAFLGADQALWRVRPERSVDGRNNRVIACYKADQDKDPILAARGPTYSTARFRDEPLARPENGLIGVMYTAWMLVPQPLVVVDPTHWLFAGTGLAKGDSIPALVSFEIDDRFANGVEPAGLRVLARSPVVDAEMRPQHATMVSYVHSSGAEVVGVGTIGWPSALGAAGYVDPRVATMTRTILDRLVGPDGRKGAPDPAGAPWLVARPATVSGAWASSVTTLAGVPDATTIANGPAASARFLAPSGIAVAANGTIYVADAPAHQIRAIATDAARTVTTLAGDGIDGDNDGPGAMARFRWPTGVAVGADGTVYVADADNHVIRAIAPDAAHTVSTWAGVKVRSGSLLDGPGNMALFDRPSGVAVDIGGGLVVADVHNCRIRRVAPDSAHTVSTLAGTSIGFSDGPAALAQFNNPSAVAVAADGTIYVLDTYNAAIRRIAPAATRTVTTLAGTDAQIGLTDGAGNVARLGGQNGLALLAGKLYLTDVASQRIRVITPGADAAGTTVATFAGSGRTALENGAGASASLAAPMGIAVAGATLVVADSGNGAIRVLTP
jgi:hypothetical protein